MVSKIPYARAAELIHELTQVPLSKSGLQRLVERYGGQLVTEQAQQAQAIMEMPGWRRAMTRGFMPDGCTFNGKQNILTDEQFASYKIGDLLDDDLQNPLIYHRTKPYREKLAERFAEDG